MIRNLKAKIHTVQWANNNYWLIESSQERSVTYLPPLPKVTRWVSSSQLAARGRIRPYSPAEQADPQSCWCNLPPHYISSQSFKPFQVSILLSPWLTTTTTTISLVSVFIFHILSGFSVCIFFHRKTTFFLCKSEPRSHSCASQNQAPEHRQLNLWATPQGYKLLLLPACLLNQIHSWSKLKFICSIQTSTLTKSWLFREENKQIKKTK